MIPLRFVAMSHNLWKTNRWPEREESLRSLLRMTPPDVLCLQELRPETRAVVDEELPEHRRVDDPFEGWLMEGTIYWRTSLFEYVSHGAEDIGILEELRRLFWVRLKSQADGRSILVTTAHYTYQGNEREAEEGISPRVDQARRTISVIDRLADADEPVLFMGDLNDSQNPIRLLRSAGYKDSHTAIGRVPRCTHPTIPTGSGVPQVLDWQFSKGRIRILGSEVIDYFVNDVAPSDHKPVATVYELPVPEAISTE